MEVIFYSFQIVEKKIYKKVLNNLEEVKFNFSKKGSEVVYNDQVW